MSSHPSKERQTTPRRSVDSVHKYEPANDDGVTTDELVTWAERWKLDISVEKTVSTVFTLDPDEACREAHLYGSDPVPSPTFLGITYDRTLSFRRHLELVKAKMKQRTNALRALSGKTWGSAASDLRTVYVGFIRSCAEYAAAGWMPGAAKSNLELVEVAQRDACRVITGC